MVVVGMDVLPVAGTRISLRSIRATSINGSAFTEPWMQQCALCCPRNLGEDNMIKRLRVEPISGYLERYRKAKSFPVSIANGFVFVSRLPPFDPDTGEIKPVAFEQQAERVMRSEERRVGKECRSEVLRTQ